MAPPSRYPKQVTPGFLPGTSARIRAEAARSSLTVSTVIRLSLERRFPALGRRPQPPRIVASGKPDTVIEHPTRIALATFEQIEAARARNGLATRNEVIRWVVEQDYPPES